MNSELMTLTYRFVFDNGSEREFTVKLDKQELLLQVPEKAPESIPEWARLESFKCPNCPLDERKRLNCPIAENLVDLIDFFANMVSYEEINLIIESDERTYTKRTSLQQGISSLIGIYMTASGCPILEKLKPMVRYHLPFATLEETTYRAITMYLLAQYFRHKRNLPADWELQNLVSVYEEVQKVNESFSDRLRNIRIEDASVNALVILDNFANYVKFMIDADLISEIECNFKAYTD